MSNAITDRPGSDVPAPDAPPPPPVRETAPSVVAADEPTFARLVGTIGFFLLLLGAASWLVRRIWPEWGRSPLLIGMCLMFGLVFLIYHAIRDGDLQVRRAYAFLGYFWMALGGILSIWPVQASATPVVGGAAVPATTYFLPFGCGALIVALLFLLPYLRNETDAAWRRVTFWLLGLVGWLCTLYGLGRGFYEVKFLLDYGLPLSLLGLAYLWTFALMRGAGEQEVDPSWYLGGNVNRLKLAVVSSSGGVLLGAVGIVTVVFAVGRSFLPTVFYGWGWIAQRPPTNYLEGPGVLLMLVGLLYCIVAAGMYSDSKFIVLTRRELASFFYSPLAYIVIFSFATVAAFHYAFFIAQYSARGGAPIREPVVLYFMGGLLLVPIIAQILVVPLLTMRLLSEEQRSGTLEVLLTSPVNDGPVVLSKYVGVLVIYFLTWLPYGLFLLALRVEVGQPYDYRPLISFAIALLCTGANYLGMGLFFSSLTRNQVVAGVLSAIGMLFLLAVWFLKEMAKENGYTSWETILEYFSFVHLWLNSLNGRLYLRDVVFQASLGAFWVFLTLKVLESRRWR